MEDKDRGDEKRGPCHIEHRQQHRRGPEPLHGFEIALGGKGNGIGRRNRQPGQSCGENPTIQPILNLRTDPCENLGAKTIKQAHGDEEPRSQGRQSDQSFLRTAAQNPIIDLKHVERPGQLQQVHKHREGENRGQKAAAA